MYDRPGRPHLRIKYTVPELAAEFLSLIGILLNAFIVSGRWTVMPAQGSYFGMQTHKLWLLLIFSLLPVGLYVALTALSGRLDRFIYPVAVNAKNAAVEYRLARDLLLSLKMVLIWAASAILWYLTAAPPGIRGNMLPAVGVAVIAGAAVILAIFHYARRMGRNA